LCGRLTARCQALEQRLRDEAEETNRLRGQLVDLGVDPDNPSALALR
jgi:hypothetical protein